jgi:hypothetical protein
MFDAERDVVVDAAAVVAAADLVNLEAMRRAAFGTAGVPSRCSTLRRSARNCFDAPGPRLPLVLFFWLSSRFRQVRQREP